MSNYCGECAKMQTSGTCKYGNEYYCEKNGKYYPVNKSACSSFIPKPNKGYQRAGCYITTIVCTILGKSDDCQILTLMRGLRENYLKNSDEGRMLLQEYDQIGPLISDRLLDSSVITAADLMNRFLIPCALYIKENNLDDAVATYKNMFLELKERFNLTELTVDYNAKTPIEYLGKARTRVKPKMYI